MDRSPIATGERFSLEVVLASRSETPTDFVDVHIEGETTGTMPHGRAVEVKRERFLDERRRWTPGKLAAGEHRQRFQIALPEGAPPSYQGIYASVQYQVRVHVSIPYWPDRHAIFSLPVESAPRMPDSAGRTALVATHPQGPVAKQPYIEVGLDATELVRGEVLRGDVSFANASAKRIRRVTVSIIGTEHIRRPGAWDYLSRRYDFLLVSGAPLEGESYPFRIAIPPSIEPSFDARIFALRWALEVRADVVLGSDAVVRVPLDILRPPPNVPLPARPRRALPVGRERLAKLWGFVAQRLGLEYDETRGSMIATSGRVTMELRRETHDGTLGTTAVYRWPHLGLDVRLGERGFLDSVMKQGYYATQSRFTILGREPAQLDFFFDEALLSRLAKATSVELDDDGATVRVAGTANAASSLERVVTEARELLHVFAAAIAAIPPPAALAAHVGAWQAFAAKVGGSLELGRLWIHDATLEGAYRFELGVAWEPASPTIVGTVARFFIEPPLVEIPSVEDPALSAVARERLREVSAFDGFHLSKDEIGFVLDEAVADPKSLEPKLEAIGALLRALRGVVAAGPFR